MTDAEQRAEHFRRAEDSCKLEGLDPGRDAEYSALKAQIVSGEMDVDEAIRQQVDRFRAMSAAKAHQVELDEAV